MIFTKQFYSTKTNLLWDMRYINWDMCDINWHLFYINWDMCFYALGYGMCMRISNPHSSLMHYKYNAFNHRAEHPNQITPN